MFLLPEDSPLKSFLGTYLLSLLADGENLLKTVEESNAYFTDYSFVVFPFAKAYEGFLKDLFFRLGVISEKEYIGHRFRIGKALNPNLEKSYRHKESVYDRLSNYCKDLSLAQELWDTWKRGRNLTFHYFPQNHHKLTLKEAKYLIVDILAVMEKALRECKVGYNNAYEQKQANLHDRNFSRPKISW